MAGHSSSFPWPSYYGHYQFFEKMMERHDRIVSCVQEGDGIYKLDRTRGDSLRVFICECYAFGIAEYHESIDKLGDLNAVIINSLWCGYSHEAKRFCRDNGVGLFTIKEFMGAINREEYWLYLTEIEKKYFGEKGWV